MFAPRRNLARGSVPGRKMFRTRKLLQRLDAFGTHDQSVIVFVSPAGGAELAKVILVQQGWKEVHNMGSHRDW